jgi:hypothetical protein
MFSQVQVISGHLRNQAEQVLKRTGEKIIAPETWRAKIDKIAPIKFNLGLTIVLDGDRMIRPFLFARVFFLLFSTGFFCSVQAAEFEVNQWYGNQFHISIWGQINYKDEEHFLDLVLAQLRMGHLITGVRVFSHGGRSYQSEEIGRQIKSLGAATYAPEGTTENPICYSGGFDGLVKANRYCACASACSHLWLAGTSRYGNVVGIHHSLYQPATPMTRAELEDFYARAELNDKKYYSDVDAPLWVLERTNRVPSSEISFLTETELSILRNAPTDTDRDVRTNCGLEPGGSGNAVSRQDRVTGNSPLAVARIAWMDCATEIYNKAAITGAARFLQKYFAHDIDVIGKFQGAKIPPLLSAKNPALTPVLRTPCARDLRDLTPNNPLASGMDWTNCQD